MSQIQLDVEKAVKADSRELLDECLKKYSEEDFQNMKLTSLSITNIACSQKKLHCIRFLAEISHSVAWIHQEFEEKSPGGGTALHYAMKGYPRPGKKPASEKNKKASRRQKEQEEFLAKFTEILKIFKLHGISLDHKNSEGSTVLHLMVKTEKYKQTMREMILHGADPMILDVNDNNILHLAAKTGIPKVFGNCLDCLDRDTRILLWQQKNKRHETPLDALKNSTAPKGTKDQYENYLQSLINTKISDEERRAKLKKRDPPNGSSGRGTQSKKSKVDLASSIGGSTRRAAAFPPKLDGSSSAPSPPQPDSASVEQIQTEPNSTD